MDMDKHYYYLNGTEQEFYLASEMDAYLSEVEQADDIWHELTRKQIEAKDARIAELENALRWMKENAAIWYPRHGLVIESGAEDYEKPKIPDGIEELVRSL